MGEERFCFVSFAGWVAYLDFVLSIVRAVHEALEGHISRRRTVLQMVDLAGLGVGPPPHHSLHQEEVGHVQQHKRIRNDVQSLGLRLCTGREVGG